MFWTTSTVSAVVVLQIDILVLILGDTHGGSMMAKMMRSCWSFEWSVSTDVSLRALESVKHQQYYGLITIALSLWSCCWRRSRLRFELNMNVKLFYLVIKRSQSSTFFGIIIKTFIIYTLLMRRIDRLYHLPFIPVEFHRFIYLNLYQIK